jgi:predicted nuclease of predicted toxin-antitoxin system
VKPLAYTLLTDENIHPEVAAELRRQGKDVVTAIELGLGGEPDTIVLRTAVVMGRVVITHDSDFGLLAVNAGEPSVGLIYLARGTFRRHTRFRACGPSKRRSAKSKLVS